MEVYKGTKYLLNSAVLTATGEYSYLHVSHDEAKAWYENGPEPISTIGYEQTAAALGRILGREVVVSRTTIQMRRHDSALVFRLALPPGSPRIEPGDKGRIDQAILEGHYELGLLRRTF